MTDDEEREWLVTAKVQIRVWACSIDGARMKVRNLPNSTKVEIETVEDVRMTQATKSDIDTTSSEEFECAERILERIRRDPDIELVGGTDGE